jgi:hypothetical protein
MVVRSPDGDEAEVIALGVRVRDGRAEVGPADGRRGALETTPAGVAAIFYGALPVTAAVALGLAGADARLAAKIDAIARIPPLTPVDAF